MDSKELDELTQRISTLMSQFGDEYKTGVIKLETVKVLAKLFVPFMKSEKFKNGRVRSIELLKSKAQAGEFSFDPQLEAIIDKLEVPKF